jgi:hypothetical protein
MLPSSVFVVAPNHRLSSRIVLGRHVSSTCHIIVLFPQVSSGLILQHNVAKQPRSQLCVQRRGTLAVRARHAAVMAKCLLGGAGSTRVGCTKRQQLY